MVSLSERLRQMVMGAHDPTHPNVLTILEAADALDRDLNAKRDLATLWALVEDLRLRVAHIAPHCRICKSTMRLVGNSWSCSLHVNHPELHDWSCQS